MCRLGSRDGTGRHCRLHCFAVHYCFQNFHINSNRSKEISMFDQIRKIFSLVIGRWGGRISFFFHFFLPRSKGRRLTDLCWCLDSHLHQGHTHTKKRNRNSMGRRNSCTNTRMPSAEPGRRETETARGKKKKRWKTTAAQRWRRFDQWVWSTEHIPRASVFLSRAYLIGTAENKWSKDPCRRLGGPRWTCGCILSDAVPKTARHNPHKFRSSKNNAVDDCRVASTTYCAYSVSNECFSVLPIFK